MNLDGYQSQALKTAAKLHSQRDKLLNSALGLTGESGEFADVIKKICFHGHELSKDLEQKLCEELGDILWYVAIAADAFNLDLSQIAEMNISKLNKRYPNGFSSFASVNRQENEEVEISSENEYCQKELSKGKSQQTIVKFTDE